MKSIFSRFVSSKSRDIVKSPDTQAHPVNQLLKELQNEGILLSDAVGGSASKSSIADSGVSLSYLSSLLHVLDLYDDITTEAVIRSLVLKATKEKKSRLFEHVPMKHRGKPSYYVVHIHSALLTSTLSTLIHNLSNEPPEKTFVWLDLFSLSQHPLGLNQQADPLFVKDVLNICDKGAAVVVDKRSPSLILSRSWCLWEIFCAVYATNGGGLGGGESSGAVKEDRGPMEATRLRICLPPDETSLSLIEFESACSKIDLGQSETSRAEDKTKILSLVKSSCGMMKMTSKTSTALLLSTHCSLRWNGGLAGVALYTSLLLHSGNLGLAQAVLHQHPGVVTDDKLQIEMLAVLKAYAAESDNELTRRDFVQALVAVAGFESFEAESIFDEISLTSSSGQDTVSLEDVPEWWRKSAEVVKMQRPPETTSEALLLNLAGLQQLLVRSKLEGMARMLNTHIEPLRKTLLAPGKHLPPMKLAGDWAALAEEMTWLIHQRDFVGCVPLLFKYLMHNASALKVDPFLLDPPDSSDDHVVVAGKMLPALLDIYVALIRGQGGHSRHYILLFSNLSKKLRKSDRSELEKMMQARVAAPSGPNAKSLEYERHKVIKDMIDLKYGENKPTSYHLINEAEMSLGSFIAGSRAVKPGKTNEAISSMASRYLGSKKVVAPGGGDEEEQSHLQSSTTSLGSSFLHKTAEAPKGGENSILFALGNGAGAVGGGVAKVGPSSLSSSQVQFGSLPGIIPEGAAGRRGSSLEIPRTESRLRPSSIVITDLPRCGSNIWQPSPGGGRSSTHSQASFTAPSSPHSPDNGGELSPNGIKTGPLSMDPHSSFDQLRQSFHRPLVKSARRHSALMPTTHYDYESPSPSPSFPYPASGDISAAQLLNESVMKMDKDGYIIVPGQSGGMQLLRNKSQKHISGPQALEAVVDSHLVKTDLDGQPPQCYSPPPFSKMASRRSMDQLHGDLDLVSRSKSAVQVALPAAQRLNSSSQAKAAFSLLPSSVNGRSK